jgi:hypothetical protein
MTHADPAVQKHSFCVQRLIRQLDFLQPAPAVEGPLRTAAEAH